MGKSAYRAFVLRDGIAVIPGGVTGGVTHVPSHPPPSRRGGYRGNRLRRKQLTPTVP